MNSLLKHKQNDYISIFLRIVRFDCIVKPECRFIQAQFTFKTKHQMITYYIKNLTNSKEQ